MAILAISVADVIRTSNPGTWTPGENEGEGDELSVGGYDVIADR